MLKNKKKSLLSKLLCSALAIMSVLSLGMITASASDYQDKPFEFTYSGDGSDVSIASRRKEDNTSSYCFNKWSKVGISVYDVGTKTASPKTSLGADGVNAKVCSDWVHLDAGDYDTISNSVYEDGFKWCNLGINPDPQEVVHIHGLWSPDSV